MGNINDKSNDLTFDNFYSRLLNKLSYLELNHNSNQKYQKIFEIGYAVLNEFLSKHENYDNLKLLIKPVGSALIGNNPNQTMIENVPFGLIGGFNDEGDKHKYIKSSLTYIAISNFFNVSVSKIIKEKLIEEYKDNNQSVIGEIKIRNENIEFAYYSDNDWKDLQFSQDNKFRNKEEALKRYVACLFKKLLANICDKKFYTINGLLVDFVDDVFGNLHGYLSKMFKGNQVFYSSLVKIFKHQIQLINYSNLCKNSGITASYMFYATPFIKQNDEIFENFGNIVVSSNKAIEKDYKLCLILQNFSLSILSVFRLIYQLEMERKLRASQIKSTVAAIMSRNMSHNLGSHVLSNLKGELENIASEFKENHDNKGLGLKSENLYGLKWFVNYLQERQDFIATIGGFENQTFMPVNFKTFVFDGFLPDDHYNRHKNGTESIENHSNILLNYIAKSENIDRDRIVIKFGHFDSKDANKEDVSKDSDKDKLVGLNISLPGGIVGRQAIFSILENIIRNAAKHGNINPKLDQKLEITINAKTSKENGSANNVDFNEYIEITVHDNLENYNDASTELGKLNKGNIKLLSEDPADSYSHKGLKEMLISAAWLRGIQVEDIDDFKPCPEKCIPPILTFESFKAPENIEHVQYRFYLLKPKEVCIILNDDKFENKSSFENTEKLIYKLKEVEEAIINKLTKVSH